MISFSGGPTQIPLTTAGFGTRTGNAEPSHPVRRGALGLQAERPVLHRVRGRSAARSSSPTRRPPAPPGRGPTGARSCPRRAAASPTTPASSTSTADSYFFYHNGALPGGGGFTRSVAVEKFNYNSDGTIPTINMTTAGAPQVGTLNPYVRQEAETIAWATGVETEPSSEGGMNVGWIENGDWIKVKGVAFGAGAQLLHREGGLGDQRRPDRAAAGRRHRPLVGTLHRPGHRRLADLDDRLLPGERRDRHPRPVPAFTGGSGYLFNIDWWRFEPQRAGATAATCWRWGPVSASTCRTRRPSPASRCRSGTARAAPGSSGRTRPPVNCPSTPAAPGSAWTLGLRHHQRHGGGHLELPRRDQPTVEPQRRRLDHRSAIGPVPGRVQRFDRQRRPGPPVDLPWREQPAMVPSMSRADAPSA